MIGLDTNVVVRFLVQDDEKQALVATRLIQTLSRERPGFLSAVVLVEIAWVLKGAYKAPRAQISAAIEGLLRSSELVVENAEAAYRALARYQAAARGDFADVFIAEIARLAGAAECVTFDESAANAFGMRLLR